MSPLEEMVRKVDELVERLAEVERRLDRVVPKNPTPPVVDGRTRAADAQYILPWHPV